MVSAFQTVRRVLAGRGSTASLGAEARKLGFRKVGIITDAGLINAGAHNPLLASLREAGIECSVYDEVQLEPTPESIARSAVWAKDIEADALLGLGGGSAMDTAKATALLAFHAGPLSQYFGMQKVPGPCLPTILVPTTAGTGSEMTSNSVITDPATDTKQGIVSDYLYARLVLLDPELTAGLPPFYTAITGIDALVHAIESYVSVNATFITDALNEKALRLLTDNIRKAYANGEDMEARAGMLYGAAASGIAFSNTQNGVIHAIGMSFSHKHNIPHGLMMAICAPLGLAFNAIAAPEKFAFISDILGSAPREAPIHEKAASVTSGFTRILGDLDIECGLGRYGITRDELAQAAEKAAAYRRLMDSNPRKASSSQLLRLLEHFY